MRRASCSAEFMGERVSDRSARAISNSMRSVLLRFQHALAKCLQGVELGVGQTRHRDGFVEVLLRSPSSANTRRWLIVRLTIRPEPSFHRGRRKKRTIKIPAAVMSAYISHHQYTFTVL